MNLKHGPSIPTTPPYPPRSGPSENCGYGGRMFAELFSVGAIHGLMDYAFVTGIFRSPGRQWPGWVWLQTSGVTGSIFIHLRQQHDETVKVIFMKRIHLDGDTDNVRQWSGEDCVVDCVRTKKAIPMRAWIHGAPECWMIWKNQTLPGFIVRSADWRGRLQKKIRGLELGN